MNARIIIEGWRDKAHKDKVANIDNVGGLDYRMAMVMTDLFNCLIELVRDEVAITDREKTRLWSLCLDLGGEYFVGNKAFRSHHALPIALWINTLRLPMW